MWLLTYAMCVVVPIVMQTGLDGEEASELPLSVQGQVRTCIYLYV